MFIKHHMKIFTVNVIFALLVVEISRTIRACIIPGTYYTSLSRNDVSTWKKRTW